MNINTEFMNIQVLFQDLHIFHANIHRFSPNEKSVPVARFSAIQKPIFHNIAMSDYDIDICNFILGEKTKIL